MEQLADILQHLQQQAQPRPDLGLLSTAKPYTYAGRVGTTDKPGSMYDMLAKPPTEVPDAEGLGGMATLAAAGGAGKAFKRGATTIQGYLDTLAANKEYFPGRAQLIPVIRHPVTGELFEGGVGGEHPSKTLAEILGARKQVTPGNMQYGYRPAYEGSPFVPESIANFLFSNKSQTDKLSGLLKRGISLDTIVSVINEHGGVWPQKPPR